LGKDGRTIQPSEVAKIFLNCLHLLQSKHFNRFQKRHRSFYFPTWIVLFKTNYQ
jgi:hypothetical protein